MDPILERYQALEDKVASYTPNLDTKRLYEAFTYADTEHHGQLRKSGEPYIIHPLAVADIVADLGLDVDSVIEVRNLGGRSGGGRHQADPGAVRLQGRGADGEFTEDAHGHGP